MKSGPVDRRPTPPAALVIHPGDRDDLSGRGARARLAEAVGLAAALGLDVREAFIAPLRGAAPSTLFGKGKVEEIATACRALAVAVVVVDGALSPIQQRNLEKAWDAKVIDRTGLILEIFGRRARTKEGRLQVELARLQYERSRLVRTWTHLERQRGGFGFLGGPGETQIEADRRLLLDRIVKLKRDLTEVRRTRGLQRQARARTPFPTIALVGYTNAGKSTLFNRLTRADVAAKDMLFATLDPTMRRLSLSGGRPAILSDTVGFISDLPHELIEAFRATLDEVREADVIVHVRDIAGEDSEAQSLDVATVLADLGIDAESGQRRTLQVWNKIDLLAPETRAEIGERAAGAGAVAVSSTAGEGVDTLLERLAGMIDQGPDLVFRLRPSDGEALAWLYRHGRVTDRTPDEPDGLLVTARLDPQALGRFEQLRPGALR